MEKCDSTYISKFEKIE